MKKQLEILKEYISDYWYILRTHVTEFWYILRTYVRQFVYKFIINPNNVMYSRLPRAYYDKDVIMLHANFETLVDFVEIELANMWAISNNRGNKSFFDFMFPESNRSAADGKSQLAWEMSLPEEENKDQVKTAKEIAALYDWWKNDRPKRKDPYEDYHNEYSSQMIANFDENGNFVLKPISRKQAAALRKAYKEEERQHKEDEKMLIRLMKIRRCLWT